MHHSQLRHMRLSVAKHVPSTGRLRVLDVGSRNHDDQQKTHRVALGDRDVDYIGIDLRRGPNVDRVMRRPYRFPVRSRSVDVVFCGSVLEHVPFFWSSMLEIARVLKVGGVALVTVPSRGHVHNTYDCWRFYPDAHRALGAWARLDLLEAFVDLPPTQPDSFHLDYAAIDSRTSYWGDSVGVYRKPDDYPRLRMALLRNVIRSFAHAAPDLADVPMPAADPRRHKQHSW